MPFLNRLRDWGTGAQSTKVSPARHAVLRALERRAGIKFRNISLLNLALCHRSFANEVNEKLPDNNERLEFLGDAVLGLTISAELYSKDGNRNEGDMSRIKSVVVSEDTLYRWAIRLDLSSYVLVGHGEDLSGGRGKRAILADAMEAVIGALYLDSGVVRARNFVLHHLRTDISRVTNHSHYQDYKSLLQELAQKKFRSFPRYQVIRHEGPDHDLTFWVIVKLNGRNYGPCSGKNIKRAEQAAAEKAYTSLTHG